MPMVSITVRGDMCSEDHTCSEWFIAGWAGKNCICQPVISHVTVPGFSVQVAVAENVVRVGTRARLYLHGSAAYCSGHPLDM
jgi:hypothetical protein